MFKRLLTISILMIAAPALAEQPSFNYVNVGYQSVDLDGGGVDVDGDGFLLGGSFEVADNWHIFGGYASTGFDFGVDLNQLRIGGGYHGPISDTTSFFAELAYVNFEVDTGALFGSVDDNGYGISVGVRSNVTDRVELEGRISQVDLGDGGDSTSVGGAARYDVSDTVAIGLFAEFDDDITSFGLEARLYF